MDGLNSFLIFIYLLGMATLLGGLIAQWGEKHYVVERALLYGAFLELCASVVFVLVNTAVHPYVQAVRIGALLVIIGLLVFTNKKKLSWGRYHSLLMLVILELAIGVFWF